MGATMEIFREDAYARHCTARVVQSGEQGIVTDRTVCYAMGGGQPGDQATLTWPGGQAAITDTRKGENGILHVLEPGTTGPETGSAVEIALDWERRHRLMRMHTALHLLCACVEGAVTGGQIGEHKSRLDFNIPAGALDKAALEGALNDLIAADHELSTRWISDQELEANLSLVRTLSVKPPMGAGRVRLVCIGDPASPVDLQPCGGTHVASTGEIGPLRIGKIENKGRQNRRINLLFGET